MVVKNWKKCIEDQTFLRICMTSDTSQLEINAHEYYALVSSQPNIDVGKQFIRQIDADLRKMGVKKAADYFIMIEQSRRHSEIAGLLGFAITNAANAYVFLPDALGISHAHDIGGLLFTIYAMCECTRNSHIAAIDTLRKNLDKPRKK